MQLLLNGQQRRPQSRICLLLLLLRDMAAVDE